MDARPKSEPIAMPVYEPRRPQPVPAYKPKKGGLASRAMPKVPRKSNVALQSAKSAWNPTPKAKTPSTGRIPKADLNRINARRARSRNSLKDWMECEKRPDSKKAAKVRQEPKASRSGTQTYKFRKWC